MLDPMTDKPRISDLMRRVNEGKGIVDDFINNLSFEMHLPNHSFTGPGTKVLERLDELLKFQKGQINESDCKFNRCSMPHNNVDAAAMYHDIAYMNSKDITKRHEADQILLDETSRILEHPNSVREKLDALFVNKVMKTKLQLGQGSQILRDFI